MEKYIVLIEIACAGDDDTQVQRDAVICSTREKADEERTKLVDKLTGRLTENEMRYEKTTDLDVVTIDSWDDDVVYDYRIINAVEL
jgi:hypothetical protein